MKRTDRTDISLHSGIFRALVVSWLAMQLLWQVMPYLHLRLSLSEQSVALLQWNGFGGSSLVSNPWFYGLVVLVKVVAAGFLVQLSRIGFWIFLIVLVADILTTAIGGLAVFLPMEIVIIFVTSNLEGAILAMGLIHRLAR